VLRTIRSCTAIAALFAVATAAAFAADATGKWTWTVNFNGNEVTQTLELKQDGEKLTGTLLGRNNQKIEIKNGTIKNNELAFEIIREFNGNEFKQTYKGKLDGDTIKGTSTGNRGGQEQTREWVAKRAK
jgi:hypothetical protein